MHLSWFVSEIFNEWSRTHNMDDNQGPRNLKFKISHQILFDKACMFKICAWMRHKNSISIILASYIDFFLLHLAVMLFSYGIWSNTLKSLSKIETSFYPTKSVLPDLLKKISKINFLKKYTIMGKSLFCKNALLLSQKWSLIFFGKILS